MSGETGLCSDKHHWSIPVPHVHEHHERQCERCGRPLRALTVDDECSWSFDPRREVTVVSTVYEPHDLETCQWNRWDQMCGAIEREYRLDKFVRRLDGLA